MTSAKQQEQLKQSAAGWQPLRIGKRDTGSPGGSPGLSAGLPRAPSRGVVASSSEESLQTAPRRTSGSYKHVATNSLVTNSPFKRSDAVSSSPTPSTSSATTSPVTSPRKASKYSERSQLPVSIGLGIATEPRKHKVNDENTCPAKAQASSEGRRSPKKPLKSPRKGRQSMAGLPNKALVTSSPFLSQSPSKLSSPFVDDEDEIKPSTAELTAAIRTSTPPPRDTTPRGSPKRSALSAVSPSRRMTGPRLPTPDVFAKEDVSEQELTPKRKTVVFADDETLEDIYEFEAESGRESMTSQASSEPSEEGDSLTRDRHTGSDPDPEDMAAIIAIQASLNAMDLTIGPSHSKMLRSTSAERALNLAAEEGSQPVTASPPARLAEFGLVPPEERPKPGSLGNSTGRRPLPTLPPTSASALRLEDIAEMSSPEVEQHSRPEPSIISRLLISSSDFGLPELKGSSPLFLDVEQLGPSTPKMVSPAESAPRASLTLKSGRPALSRETVLANRGKGPEASQPIAARPPMRPRAATLSDTQVPKWRGSPISSDQLEPLSAREIDAMSSPLDRLMGSGKQASLFDSTDAGNTSDSDWERAMTMSPSRALVAHREALRQKRKEIKAASREESPFNRSHRRRSLSQGDVPMNLPTSGSAKSELSLSPSLLDVANGDASPAMKFSESLSRDIDSVADSHGRAYRLRQHRTRSIVYGSDSGLATPTSSTSDLSPGRQWRKIARQSDVHINAEEMRRAESSPLPLPTKPAVGRIFVKLLDVTLDALPLPRQPAQFRVVFSNDHTVLRNTPLNALATRVDLDLEFELIKDPKLQFRIALCLESEPFPKTGASLQNKSSVSGLKKLFGSPKKPRPVSSPVAAPAREPIMEFCNTEREFAICKVLWEDLQSQYPGDKCKMARRDFVVPMQRGAGAPSALLVGKLRLRTFYVPSLPGIDLGSLPTSLDEAYADSVVAEWQERILCEGSLSQLGLDCAYWRRRRFQLKGQQLLAISEVTNEVKVAIDMAHITALDDLNKPTPATSSGTSAYSASTSTGSLEDDEALTSIPFSFRLAMNDGTTVSFYADDERSKESWMHHLQRLRGRNRPIKPWVLAWKKLQAESVAAPSVPRKSSPARTRSEASVPDALSEEKAPVVQSRHDSLADMLSDIA